MSTERSFDSLTSDALESRLRSLAHDMVGESGVDDLELRHLLEILTRSSLLPRDIFDAETLDWIFLGETKSAAFLGKEMRSGDGPAENRLQHLWRIPDRLRDYGDKCLYDLGLAGRTKVRGIALDELGPRAYSLTSRVLEMLADDRTLRQFYENNLIERLPIEEEIIFLRQCASRFRIYAQILQAFRAGEPAGDRPGPTDRVVEPIPSPLGRIVPGVEAGADTRATEGSLPDLVKPLAVPAPAPGRRFGDDLRNDEREDRLTLFERAVLFSALDLVRLREHLKATVIDQDAAVDQLCDDLSVYALGTQGHPRPRSYFLVGPTGVGKNYLMESLARQLESMWGVEVPFLILEGAQYTYPSDVGELKGSTRGFIRSDEEGILSEFHARARQASLSILLVDEIEKAHPQLSRFFLSLMDRGTTMDNRGRLLRFPATFLAFTSNLGYSDPEVRARPIGYEARGIEAFRQRTAARNVRRGLPPEFLNRLRVIHFAALSRQSAARIVEQEVGRIADRYRGLHGIELQVTGDARGELVNLGFSEEYGARHLISDVDRICNVEVSLRLHAGAKPLTPQGVRLLERIREARRGDRAIDEPALREEVERFTRLGGAARRIHVDHRRGQFTYKVETG